MTIRRAVPNIQANDPQKSNEFYVDFLGMQVAMEQSFITTFASPANPSVQISVIRPDASGAPHPDISIEVDDVDDKYADALKRNVEIVYSLTDEPWGVRRFFAADPNGTIVNVLSHIQA